MTSISTSPLRPAASTRVYRADAVLERAVAAQRRCRQRHRRLCRRQHRRPTLARGPAEALHATPICRRPPSPISACAWRRLRVCPAALLRVGFVGELGYEIHMPAQLRRGMSGTPSMEAGKPLGIRPFGVEAQRVLRLEKGHIIIGQDTDGLTHPYEADMAWAIAKSKPFFVGQRSIAIQNGKGLTRKLVRLHARPMHRPRRRRNATWSCAAPTSSAASPRPCARPRSARSSASAYVAPDQAEPGKTLRHQGGGRPPASRRGDPDPLLRPRKQAAGDVTPHGLLKSQSLPPPMPRRSCIYRVLQQAGARFAPVNDGRHRRRLRQGGRDRKSRRRAPWASPTSPCSRAPASRARGAVEWLTSQGLAIGPDSNRAYPPARRRAGARLAPTEIFLIDSAGRHR